MARILITIPTWNEELIIAKTIERVIEVVKTSLHEHSVIIEIADNASMDRMAAIVSCLPVELLSLSEKGKGLAIRRSWERHLDDSDVLIFTDADLAADLSVLPVMIDVILHGESEIVCGSRFIAGSSVRRRLVREILSRIFRHVQHGMLHLPVEDAQCGLKAISVSSASRLLPKCSETGWLFDSELLAFAQKSNFRIREVPVQWIEHRDPGRRSALNVWRDSWSFLLGLVRIRRHVFR